VQCTTGGGVRAQKKARTRAAIRAAALELFTRQGFSSTTVEQIAHASGVSHTTFFRYFTSKEQVIIGDDLRAEREATFAAIPPGLNHFDLVRRMVTGMYELGIADEWVANYDRIALIHADPHLRYSSQVETERIISEATEFIADYTGVPTTDLHLRAFVAAISGVMFYIAHAEPQADHAVGMAELLEAIDLLEQGLPMPTKQGSDETHDRI